MPHSIKKWKNDEKGDNEKPKREADGDTKTGRKETTLESGEPPKPAEDSHEEKQESAEPPKPAADSPKKKERGAEPPKLPADPQEEKQKSGELPQPAADSPKKKQKGRESPKLPADPQEEKPKSGEQPKPAADSPKKKQTGRESPKLPADSSGAKRNSGSPSEPPKPPVGSLVSEGKSGETGESSEPPKGAAKKRRGRERAAPEGLKPVTDFPVKKQTNKEDVAPSEPPKPAADIQAKKRESATPSKPAADCPVKTGKSGETAVTSEPPKTVGDPPAKKRKSGEIAVQEVPKPAADPPVKKRKSGETVAASEPPKTIGDPPAKKRRSGEIVIQEVPKPAADPPPQKRKGLGCAAQSEPAKPATDLTVKTEKSGETVIPDPPKPATERPAKKPKPVENPAPEGPKPATDLPVKTGKSGETAIPDPPKPASDRPTKKRKGIESPPKSAADSGENPSKGNETPKVPEQEKSSTSVRTTGDSTMKKRKGNEPEELEVPLKLVTDPPAKKRKSRESSADSTRKPPKGNEIEKAPVAPIEEPTEPTKSSTPVNPSETKSVTPSTPEPQTKAPEPSETQTKSPEPTPASVIADGDTLLISPSEPVAVVCSTDLGADFHSYSDTSHNSLNHGRLPPIVDLFFNALPDMMSLSGRSVSSFISSVISCLFRPGLTLAPGEHFWTYGEHSRSSTLLQIRRDLIHALLSLSSLSFLCSRHISMPSLEIVFPDFPHELFMRSICELCRSYLQNIPILDLLRNCLAFSARLLPIPEFQAAIARTPVSCFLNAFFADSAKLLDSTSPLTNEAISFVYAALLFQPDFIATLVSQHRANQLILELLTIAHFTLEHNQFCYIHSVILSSLLLLFGNPAIAAGLSETVPGENGESFGDLLLNVTSRVCEEEAFWPSFVCILHLIAPHAGVFSVDTVLNVWQILEQIVKERSILVSLIVEAFAEIVQREGNEKNGFLIMILRRSTWFEQKQGIAGMIVRKWVKAAKIVAKNESELDRLLERLAQVKVEEGGELVEFKKHIHSFQGEIANTWDDWVVILFVRACREEVTKMQRFQLQYDDTLLSRLTS
jgi:hypothetical protein